MANLLQGVDLRDPDQRARVVAEMTEAEEIRYQAVLTRAAQLRIPVRLDGPDHQVSILYDLRGDRPLYRQTLNKNAAISSAANLLYPAPYSLDGSGIQVGIWDAGSVFSTHQELIGRVTNKNSSTATDSHSTHVAGTIGASGVQPNAKGMAPAASLICYDWSNDIAEMTATGAASSGDVSRISLSNHSYGYEAETNDMGRYDIEARTTDALAASLPYFLMCWAAGNDQDVLTNKNGYQSITFNALAKNILTVGAVNDAVSGGARSPAAGTMSSFSSWGPCDDGRIKPDIVANGVALYSTLNTSNTAYASYSGTSMATPSTVGSLVLLAQLYAREFSGMLMRASLLKALIIHTADDLGPAGPDYQYGWGLINVQTAADLIFAHKASLASPRLIENALTASVHSRAHTFTWDGVSPIRVTLCWTDPAGVAQTAMDSRTPNLIHNLDLTLTSPDGTTVTYPYRMPFAGTWTDASMSSLAVRGKNNVDTVERVDLPSPTQAGIYTATVALDGSLTTSAQIYSLVISGGISVAVNPPPAVAVTSPEQNAAVLLGAPVLIQATASDEILGGSSGSVAHVEFFVDGTPLGTDSTSPYTQSWQPGAFGTYQITALATDSEGASTLSAPVIVQVLTGDGTPVLNAFSPASGEAGTSVTLTGSNFTDVVAVRFNGAESGSFQINSLTGITALVPTIATSGPITVETSRGTAQSTGSFTVISYPVVISQIYGGGGVSGATYKSDYVELYNRNVTPQSLEGWSLQYASATGTSWARVPLTGAIAPGSYYLISLAGGSYGLSLPTVDCSGSINMSVTQGKVALRNTNIAFNGSTPIGQTGLQDFVGYGGANRYEGSGPAPTPSITSAVIRAGSGATDTGDNADDFSVGTPNPRNSSISTIPVPSLQVSGTLGAVPATYGSASPTPTSFSVAGSNLLEGIHMTSPTGFEISKTSGGATGYASTQTVGTTGTVSNTTIYLRLAAGTTVGAHTGAVVCTSVGAVPASVETVSSAVSPAALSVRATDQSKPFGTTLTLGNGNTAFSSQGLVLGETIGSITLSADGGLQANDAAGTYVLTPAAATGGTFTPANYTIQYQSGVLTVTAPSFNEWIQDYPAVLGLNGLLDDPDHDGLNNLMEYFLRLNPAIADNQGALTPGNSPTHLFLDYRRSKALDTIHGEVTGKISLTDADAWSTLGLTDELLQDYGDYELRRATVTIPPEGIQFLRLQVTSP